MPTAAVILVAVSALFASALAVMGWAVRRQITRNDTMRTEISAHTAALAQLTTSLTVVTTGQTRLVDQLEEVEDGMQQLQIATALLRERMTAHERFTEALGRHQPPGSTREPSRADP